MNVSKLNGNDIHDIIKVFSHSNFSNQQPNVLLSYTTAGKGVNFLENNYEWHSKVLTKSELELAVTELEN